MQANKTEVMIWRFLRQKKAADLRWKRKNTHNFTVQVANREADAFRAVCAIEGVTPHSVLLRAIREMIARHAGEVSNVEPEEPRK